jgi:protein gp37
MYFVNSMSDLFHEDVPFAFVDRVFEVMAACPQHTFQVLTKRPDRMLAYCEARYEQLAGELDGLGGVGLVPWPNVWLGVSVENRRFVWRVDVLRDVPAVVRFVSAEPLLGPLTMCGCGHAAGMHGARSGLCGVEGCECEGVHGALDLADVDWLIVGGESGPGHRPVHPGWVRELRDLALEAEVAFFFKQWGGRTPGAGGRLLDGREWAQFPSANQAVCA